MSVIPDSLAGVNQPPPTTTTASAKSRADPYAGRAGRQWWLVFCVMVLMTLGYIDRQVLTLLVNPIKADLHISDTQIAVIIGAAFVFSNLAFTIPAGYLADRASRRAMIGVGAIVWSVMSVFFGMSTSFVQMIVARAGVGFGESVIGPCSMSMLRNGLDPERRGRGFAMHGMASMGGSALALLLGGWLLHTVTQAGIRSLPVIGPVAPWQIVLIIVGLLGLPFALLMLTIREPLHKQHLAADGSVAANGFGDALNYMGSRWRVYLPLVVYQTVSGMSAMSFGAWIASMVGRSYGLSIPQIGATMGLMMLTIPPIGLWCAGLLLDRFGSSRGPGGAGRMCVVGMVLALFFWLSAWIAPLSPTVEIFWVLLGVHFIMSGTAQSSGQTLLAEVTPPAIMGKVSAIQLLVYGVFAAAVGPVVVARVSDTVFSGHGNFALAHAISLVVCCYGAAAMAAIFLTWRGLKREARLAA